MTDKIPTTGYADSRTEAERAKDAECEVSVTYSAPVVASEGARAEGSDEATRNLWATALHGSYEDFCAKLHLVVIGAASALARVSSQTGTPTGGDMSPAMLAANLADSAPVTTREAADKMALHYRQLCALKPERYEVFIAGKGYSHKLSDAIAYYADAAPTPSREATEPVAALRKAVFGRDANDPDEAPRYVMLRVKHAVSLYACLTSPSAPREPSAAMVEAAR